MYDLLQTSINNLQLINSHLDHVKDLDNFNDEQLIFSFYLTKELLFSKSSALNHLINDYEYLISKKVLLDDVIEKIINHNDQLKNNFLLIDNEQEEYFTNFKSIISKSVDTSTTDKTSFILNNFNKGKASRQAMRNGIKYFVSLLKQKVANQFRYLQYYLTQSTPKHRYKKQKIKSKMEISFYPSPKLDTTSITFFCIHLSTKNFISKEQNIDFERAMLGHKIADKIIWKREISTLFYFIQQMHKTEYLIDHSACKWKATANIFSLVDQEIDFKKLRGLKKTKYCVVIDELFNELQAL